MCGERQVIPNMVCAVLLSCQNTTDQLHVVSFNPIVGHLKPLGAFLATFFGWMKTNEPICAFGWVVGL